MALIKFGELVKHLIDTDNDEENEIQDVFYDHLLPKFIRLFESEKASEASLNARTVVLDILIFCANISRNKLSKSIVNLDLLSKLSSVLKFNNKFLSLMLIQLFRLVLAGKVWYSIN